MTKHFPSPRAIEQPTLFPDCFDRAVLSVGSLRGVVGQFFERATGSLLNLPSLKTDSTKPVCPDFVDEANGDLFEVKAAENERLTKERDEARAQVAAAYEVAAQAKVFMAEEGGFLTRVPLLPETKAAIRTLTPADAQAALAAYGRSKVQEGMQRVIDRLRHEGQINPSLTYADAIEWAEYALADMETLK